MKSKRTSFQCRVRAGVLPQAGVNRFTAEEEAKNQSSLKKGHVNEQDYWFVLGSLEGVTSPLFPLVSMKSGMYRL